MTSEINKRLVRETWQAFWRGDVEAGLLNMADDVTWFIPGNMKTSGLKRGKAEVGKFRHNNLDIFLELQRNVVGLYAEGATVVLEVAASGRLKNGNAYENAGCVVWEIENGKIQRVREYIDTAKAAAINEVSE
jgi:uncharacterized protein